MANTTYAIVNDNLDTAFNEIRSILITERNKRVRASLGIMVDNLLKDAHVATKTQSGEAAGEWGCRGGRLTWPACLSTSFLSLSSPCPPRRRGASLVRFAPVFPKRTEALRTAQGLRRSIWSPDQISLRRHSSPRLRREHGPEGPLPDARSLSTGLRRP